MRTDVVNTVSPSGSLEESPAMSFAAILFSSPACLSVVWDPHVSRSRTQAGAWQGRAASGPRQRLLRGPPFLRAGPPVVDRFSNVFLFYSFHRFI